MRVDPFDASGHEALQSLDVGCNQLFHLNGHLYGDEGANRGGVGWGSLGVRVTGLLPYLLEEFFEALEPVEDVVLLVVGVTSAGGREDVDLGSTNEFGARAGGGARSEAVGVGCYSVEAGYQGLEVL